MNIFDEKISEKLLKKAVDESESVYKALNKYFSKNKLELTKELYNKNSYHNILWALSEIASQPQYFDFATRKLLDFAAKEGELGIYHQNYKALHPFERLFVNACSSTNVSLTVRKQYLEALIKEADEESNYYKLYFLMKILGVAANAFESGEDNYIEDEYFEGYINFAIDTLLYYAGIQDENGLNSTAEEELHRILRDTINETDIWGATNTPFRILKAYLVNDWDWNESPVYHIDKLYEFIQFCKENKEDDLDIQHIKDLELRFEQLISLGAEREFLAENFNLYLGAKKIEKICEIDVDKDEHSNLNLHERQSLAERLVFSGTTSLHDINRGMPKTTYLIANFGMVISEHPHIKKCNSKRIFRTIPVELLGIVISGREYGYGGHAEEGLYEYLLKKENIIFLLSKFKEKIGIKFANHKIYAVILDLHGTYDMCLSCSDKGLSFQNEFRTMLLSCLPEMNYETIKKQPSTLPIVIRYSSDFKYHYENNSENKKKGILTITKNKGGNRDLKNDIAPIELPYIKKRDIRNFGSNLLVHGKENWHSFWSISSNRQNFTNKKLPLENWTAFTTDYQYQKQLTLKQKTTNYTREGLVDTKAKDIELNNTETTIISSETKPSCISSSNPLIANQEKQKRLQTKYIKLLENAKLLINKLPEYLNDTNKQNTLEAWTLELRGYQSAIHKSKLPIEKLTNFVESLQQQLLQNTKQSLSYKN